MSSIQKNIFLQSKLNGDMDIVHQLLDNGQMTEKSKCKEHQVENDIITLKVSKKKLESKSQNQNVKKKRLSSMQELAQPNKEKILKDKLNFSKKIILKARLSAISDQDLIITEKESKNFLKEYRSEISRMLPLPIQIDSVDMEQNCSNGFLKKKESNSWFSAEEMKMTNLERKSLEEKFSTSVISSQQNIMEEKSRIIEKIDQRKQKTVLRAIQYKVKMSTKLKNNIIMAMHVTRFIYNKCVALSKKLDSPKISLKFLRDQLINQGELNLFNGTKYETFLNKIPYDVKDGAIREFMTALKTQKKLVKEGKRKFFYMKYRKKKSNQNIVINHKHLKFQNNHIFSCFPSFWGKTEYFTCKENIQKYKISHDTRLIWAKNSNTFYLSIPIDKEIQENKNGKTIALDPGLRIFQTTFDTEGNCEMIGRGDYYKKIKPLVDIAERMRQGNKREFQNGKKIFRKVKNSKEQRGLIKKAQQIEDKIKRLLVDMQRKVCKKLCSSYKTIILPKFETQNMTEKRNSKRIWKRKIGKQTSQGLSRMSHYQFQQLLIAKGEEYNTNVIIGNERNSTKTCTHCFAINEDIGSSSIFSCKTCNKVFHRDINAARNILLLNWDENVCSL